MVLVASEVTAGSRGPDRKCARPGRYSRARELHKQLHTHRTFDEEQVAVNEKAPTCGAFAKPSDGLEPSTPSAAADVWRAWANDIRSATTPGGHFIPEEAPAALATLLQEFLGT
jgi:hypothetical protein